MPSAEESAEPSQTNPNNLSIMNSFMRHDAGDQQAKGDINAPVTMVVFSDFACPYCTKFAQQVDPELEDLVADGTLRIEWYDLAQITESSPLAAQAGIAAAEQGKFWEFHDVVYAAATRADTPSTPSRPSSTSRPRQACPTWISSARPCSTRTPSPRWPPPRSRRTSRHHRHAHALYQQGLHPRLP